MLVGQFEEYSKTKTPYVRVVDMEAKKLGKFNSNLNFY